MKALNPRLTHEYGRGWLLTFEIDQDSTGQAKMLVDQYREGYVEVTVERWSDKRSIQANAYFHVLCNLIAKESHQFMDDVKKHLVSTYGTLARGKDGKFIGVLVPANTDIEAIYPYVRYIDSKNGFAQYLFYKRTSDLNREEMSRLIDGAVDEAKALGIETMTPAELDRMMNRYKEACT